MAMALGVVENVCAWTADIKVWDSGSDEPASREGTETTIMECEFWAISEFKGEFFRMKASGSGTFGYEPVNSKFVERDIGDHIQSKDIERRNSAIHLRTSVALSVFNESACVRFAQLR